MFIILLLLCIGLYICQNIFNKLFSINYPRESGLASASFNIIYGVVVSIVVFTICNGFKMEASPTTIVFGVIEGVFLFFYNMASTRAATTGPYAFQIIMAVIGCISFAIVIPILVWGDTIKGLHVFAIIVMLLAIVLLNKNGLDFSNRKPGYFFWIALLFTSNGIYGVLMDSQQRVMEHREKNEMIIVTFATAAIIGLGYFLIKEGDKVKIAFSMGKSTAAFALCSSLAAAFAVYCNMKLLGHIPVSILFSVQNGSIMVGNVVLSAIIFKEKMNKTALAGIAIILFSIFLLSV